MLHWATGSPLAAEEREGRLREGGSEREVGSLGRSLQ